MPDFDSGVKGYVYARAAVYECFPVDMRDGEHVACEYCRYFRRSPSQCTHTGEIVLHPDKYVGARCPFDRITREEFFEAFKAEAKEILRKGDQQNEFDSE